MWGWNWRRDDCHNQDLFSWKKRKEKKSKEKKKNKVRFKFLSVLLFSRHAKREKRRETIIMCLKKKIDAEGDMTFFVCNYVFFSKNKKTKSLSFFSHSVNRCMMKNGIIPRKKNEPKKKRRIEGQNTTRAPDDKNEQKSTATATKEIKQNNIYNNKFQYATTGKTEDIVFYLFFIRRKILRTSFVTCCHRHILIIHSLATNVISSIYNLLFLSLHSQRNRITTFPSLLF